MSLDTKEADSGKFMKANELKVNTHDYIRAVIDKDCVHVNIADIYDKREKEMGFYHSISSAD